MRQHQYETLPEEVRANAAVAHERFKEGWRRWLDTGARSAELLNLLSRALLVVRNNLSHGEKTRLGPDRNRAQRNLNISRIVHPLLEDILDFVLGRPSQKLIAYGTMRPGQPNHSVLDVTGIWLPATITGVIAEDDGLPVLQLSLDPVINVELFKSPSLAAQWPRLDEFEGSRYIRVLALYRHNGQMGVANVYHGAPLESGW